MSEDAQTRTVADGVARVEWRTAGVDAVRAQVEAALADHDRVEAHVAVGDSVARRTATWSGLRQEGVRRGVRGDLVVYARLRGDTPLHEPEGFRALLNSFLPRKRAIAQVLLRDDDGRVLLCRLTYKRDWDLPGGVVEVGESPAAAAAREVREELGLDVRPGRLLLTDWLPPWSGWDDALCLVFDGGVHAASLADGIVREEREIAYAGFCGADQVAAHAADFTARRVAAATAALATPGGAPAYAESGHPRPEPAQNSAEASS